MTAKRVWGASAVALAALAAPSVGLAQVTPDFNDDGQITPSDISSFVNLWYAELSGGGSSPGLYDSDADGDHVLSPADVSMFVNTWMAAINDPAWALNTPVVVNGVTVMVAGALRSPANTAVVDAGGGQARVTWTDRSSGETGFTVDRQTSTNGVWGIDTMIQAAANATSLTDTPGAGLFRYRVRAHNNSSVSQWSSWAQVTVAAPGTPGAPAAPSNLQVVGVNSTDVLVSWTDNASNETGFEVVRQMRVVVNGVEGYTGWTMYPLGANVTSVTLSSGAGTFRYMVRAVNAAGQSAYTPWFYYTIGGASPPPPVLPAAPSNPAAVDAGSGQMRITWTDNAGNENGFEIERNPPFAAGIVSIESPNVVSYTDNPGNGTFSYHIRAWNAAGVTTWTSWATGTVSSAGNPPPPPPPSTGWTTITPSADSRIVYVSSSSGNDGNSGLTSGAPVRTLAAGIALLRSGFPDQLLLKKGDVWAGESFGQFAKSGRSATERMLIGAYGAGARPKVMPTAANGFTRYRLQSTGKLAIIGIHFQPTAGGEYSNEGIQWLGGPDMQPDGGTDILIEDCRFTKFFRGYDMQGVTNLVIRRCVFEDEGSPQPTGYSPASGYAGLCNNVTVEENYTVNRFFTYGVRDPWVQDSSYYLQDELQGTIIFRRNIVVYKGTYGPIGVQMRCPGSIDDNVFYGCNSGVDLGQVSNGNYAVTGINGDVSGNVILHGVNMNATNDRGIGILVSNTGSFTVANNIIANKAAISGGTALDVDPSTRGAVRNLTAQNNILYDWNGIFIQQGSTYVSGARFIGNQIQDPGSADTNPVVGTYSSASSVATFTGDVLNSTRAQGNWFSINYAYITPSAWAAIDTGVSYQALTYPAPTRDLASYGATLGLGGTLDGIMDALLNQSRDTWNANLAIDPVLTYLRGGFGR